MDIREPKLTLRVGDEEMTFGLEDRFKEANTQNEVFNIDGGNGLEELEKLMEEGIQAIQEVKRTQPRASIPTIFEVFAYKTPSSLVSGEYDEDLVLINEEEVLIPPAFVDEKIATMELKSE